ncbi:MAG: oxidoreductase [Verrucomicrobia bacterium]|nr:oxidoreductase [Verrucomicrobiota bacterium]
MTPSAALAILILGPLAGAVLTFALPRRGRWLAFVVAAVTAWSAVALARHVHGGGTVRHLMGGWGAPLGIDLRADGLAAWLLLVAAGVSFAVMLYAPRYFMPTPAHADTGATHRQKYFWPLFLFLWAALNALFLSADIFNLYVTLELLGFAAVTLVALAGGRAALNAALRYLFVSLAGSLFYLMGVALVYGAHSTVDLTLLAQQVQPGPVSWTALALMTAGLMMKAAVFPMHFWLPPAHAHAPAPVSALLSALVVKGAFYILLRLWFEAFGHVVTPAAGQWLGALGAAAILWGSVLALFQSRLKLLIAYSTVAQLGYLLLVFPLAANPGGFNAWGGALLLLAAHACAKTALFLAAGNLLHAAGHDRIKDLGGLAPVLPLTVTTFALASVSLIGLPPSSGFVGKWLLLNSALSQGQWWWTAVILVGGLLAAAYTCRVLLHFFTNADQASSATPVPAVMEWTALSLALLAVVLGLAGSWPLELLRAGAPVTGPVLMGGPGP